MFFLPRGARPLGSHWLWFHLLLWTALVASEGEECCSWISGKGDPAGPFPCPGPEDDADAQFCCGTCSAPFCCSSEAARLDQAQCPASQRTRKTSSTIQPRADSTDGLPVWAIVVVVIVAVILIVPIGCALSFALQYAYRQLRRWWASRNGNPANIPQPPPRRRPSMSDLFAALAVGPPPYDVVCPHGRTDLPRTTTGPSAEELGQANIGYQEDEAQPSPSQACASITVQPSSAAEGSLGPRRRRSASVGNAGEDSAFGDAPPSYGSWALASVWALATLRGNPWVRYPVRGNRRGLQVDPSGTSPWCSDVASPAPDPNEPPPSYEVAVAGGFEVLPYALESLSVVQFRRATSGASEDEVVFGPRPAVPDAAAGGPISEPE